MVMMGKRSQNLLRKEAMMGKSLQNLLRKEASQQEKESRLHHLQTLQESWSET